MKKELFKYYKANSGPWEGLNLVCVCTIQHDTHFQVIGRGVSVCSLKDEPDDEAGKLHARNHALHAIKGRKNILITIKDAILNIIKTDCPFVYHSEASPTLTWQESKFFFGRKHFIEKTLAAAKPRSLTLSNHSISDGMINSLNIDYHNDRLAVKKK